MYINTKTNVCWHGSLDASLYSWSIWKQKCQQVQWLAQHCNAPSVRPTHFLLEHNVVQQAMRETALLWQYSRSVLNKHGPQIYIHGYGLYTPAKCVIQKFSDAAELQQGTRHTSYCVTWLKFVSVCNSPSWNVSTGTWNTAVNFRNILYIPSQSQTTSRKIGRAHVW
jgi:hypothetical protein